MMSRAGMTSRLDRLEAANLITRTLDRNDRRSFRIALTGHGRRLIDAAATNHIAALAPLHDGLNPRQQKQLDEVLRALQHELERTTEPPRS
jgi:DNA-binding MarR family transcriptional regulator